MQQEEKTTGCFFYIGDKEYNDSGSMTEGDMVAAMEFMRSALIRHNDETMMTEFDVAGEGVIGLCFAVKYVTGFDGTAEELYRFVSGSSIGSIINQSKKIKEAYEKIMDQWWRVKDEIERRERAFYSAGATMQRLSDKLFGDDKNHLKNAAMIRSMLTQAMIDVRREAKSDTGSKADRPSVLDFSSFKPHNPDKN